MRPRHSQRHQGIDSNIPHQRLIDDAEHRDYVNVLRLGDKFRENPNVIDHSLSVCVSHRTIQEVEDVFLSGVIVTCAWTGNSESDKSADVVVGWKEKIKLELPTHRSENQEQYVDPTQSEDHTSLPTGRLAECTSSMYEEGKVRLPKHRWPRRGSAIGPN